LQSLQGVIFTENAMIKPLPSTKREGKNQFSSQTLKKIMSRREK